MDKRPTRCRPLWATYANRVASRPLVVARSTSRCPQGGRPYFGTGLSANTSPFLVLISRDFHREPESGLEPLTPCLQGRHRVPDPRKLGRNERPKHGLRPSDSARLLPKVLPTPALLPTCYPRCRLAPEPRCPHALRQPPSQSASVGERRSLRRCSVTTASSSNGVSDPRGWSVTIMAVGVRDTAECPTAATTSGAPTLPRLGSSRTMSLKQAKSSASSTNGGSGASRFERLLSAT